jgi:DNA-binding transcriptional regulator PaaX
MAITTPTALPLMSRLMMSPNQTMNAIYWQVKEEQLAAVRKAHNAGMPNPRFTVHEEWDLRRRCHKLAATWFFGPREFRWDWTIPEEAL